MIFLISNIFIYKIIAMRKKKWENHFSIECRTFWCCIWSFTTPRIFLWLMTASHAINLSKCIGLSCRKISCFTKIFLVWNFGNDVNAFSFDPLILDFLKINRLPAWTIDFFVQKKIFNIANFTYLKLSSLKNRHIRRLQTYTILT